jgi:biopolymer transport protein ExbB/TolQ
LSQQLHRPFPVEFVYQTFSLIVAILLVHAVYVSLIRPQADVILEANAIAMQEDEGFVPDRSVYVLVRDFEQEACFILALWALSIIAYKGARTGAGRRLLDDELVPAAEGTKILPEDAREYARQIEAMPPERRDSLLPRALLTGLHRFTATRSIQDVSETAKGVCEAEAERLESELSMLKYIAWAIPSIGFIGTVRGIGEALGQAHKAVEGDITGVTQSLGVAFNSTFIALLISIVIMFLLHQLQLQQERYVLDAESYVDRHLIQRLRVSS